MMIEITKLYIWGQFGWLWHSVKVTVVREITNLGVHFLANLNIDLDETQYVATTCWFVEVNAPPPPPLPLPQQVIFKGENSAD